MPVQVGMRIGPYEILAPAGSGGMGEVYRALDTRLERVVALKVMPTIAANDPDRLHRFEQEARSVAALSHPNILAIYDVGSFEGAPYLVTEFLEGETLRQRLDEGAIAVRRSVEYAQQIAQGLSAAHERGIVHRDLKPENVFLTKDGHAKLLDFGLAKITASGVKTISPESATIAAATQAGMVLGTAGYMAPEQVRAGEVDHRADIFSFGAMLYEMISGERAFHGASSVETMNAILKSEPPEIDAAKLHVPPGLELIVRHCLEKNPADRFQSARDLTFALGSLSGSETSISRMTRLRPQKKTLEWLPWAIAVLAMIAVAAVMFLRPAAQAVRQDFAIPMSTEVSAMSLSPDGTMLAYVSPDDKTGKGVLYVRRIGGASGTRVNGTDGAMYPFWSPDGKSLGFFADSKLKRIATDGASAQVLATAGSPRGGSWSKKGVIIYAPEAGGPLWRVDEDGSNAHSLTGKIFANAESTHRWPFFLPDGDHFIFRSGTGDTFDKNRTGQGIILATLEAKGKKLIVDSRCSPAYANGELFYVDDSGALVSAKLDISTAKLTGQPKFIASGVGQNPSTYFSSFTVAQNGTVVYQSGSGAPISQLTWFDREGKEAGRIGDAGLLSNPILSPDNSRVAFDVADTRSVNVDVWLMDIQRGGSTRFTFDPSEETTGLWSRKGKAIAYRSSVNGGELHIKASNGAEKDKLLAYPGGAGDILPTSWAPDDEGFMATFQPNNGGTDLVYVTMDGKITPFQSSPASEMNGQISPDGKWVAYQSNESGTWEIYVTTFPAPGGKWQVSRGGGTEPRWRPDGKEIYYLTLDSMLVAGEVSSDSGFATSHTSTLFQMHPRPLISSTDIFSYDVSHDGKRFLVNNYTRPAQVPLLNIILNATAGARN